MKNRALIYLFSMFILASVSPAKAQVNLEDGLIRHYALDGNLDDSSPNAQHATNQGAISTSRYQVDNTALETDGSTKATMPSIGNWGDSLTISYWFKAGAPGTNQQHLSSRDGTSGATMINLFINATSNNKIRFRVASDNAGNSEITSVNSIIDNEWNHVICELDVAGQGIKVILNGSETVTGYTVTPRYLNETIGIGNWGNPYVGAGTGLIGKIDDVRIYNRVLTSDEQLYLLDENNFEMGVDYGLLVHYPFNNSADDESGNNNHGTENNINYVDDVNSMSVSAISLNGSLSSSINMGTGVKPDEFPMAVSLWVKTNDIQTPQFLFRNDKWQSGVTYAGLVMKVSSGRLTAAYGSDLGAGPGARKTRFSDTLELGVGAWHHVVANYVSPQQIDLYIDGQLSTDGDYSGSANSIGYNASADGFVGVGLFDNDPFTGQLDEVRVYGHALSQDNINELLDYNSSMPTGVSQVEEASFSAYPNPTNGLVNLQYKGEAIISVFDLAGNKLMKTSHNGQSLIDLSGYAKGMYIIRSESKTEVLTNNIILQ